MAGEKATVLIVDDDPFVREFLEHTFSKQGHVVVSCERGADGVRMLWQNDFDAVFLDVRLPDSDGIAVLRQMRNLGKRAEIVMITGFASVDTAVQAMREGAYDYLQKPLSEDAVLRVLDKIRERHHLLELFDRDTGYPVGPGRPERIITRSPRMLEILELVDRVAPTDCTVLIMGESGTGKELIAKAIHYRSRRREKPFIVVDCGALVETLFESELFGHEKGAFTGATQTRLGSFELANGGTFFFDEIGNISLSTQAKILRAIQEKEIRRVGGNKPIQVDVRIVAATNLDLRRAVDSGKFREDLFYRLTVFPIYLPPLRERKEDILPLANYFLRRFARQLGKQVFGLSKEAEQILVQYSWPGNVRELENAIERALVLEDSEQIRATNLPEHIVAEATGGRFVSPEPGIRPLWEIERDYIALALKKVGGNISKASRLLEIDRKTLYAKIRKYGLES
ncbi:MAG: sigma-54 dependent transcriptional regulator [candidate division KSB1 bacterium]|nr:sigma-54 dependent transcriptional regulator [candidate division KSB1 bacterium]